tara:strand:+ start:315 stop:737 length:423 start_codon:yes stop_codon:yes gene_type:complete
MSVRRPTLSKIRFDVYKNDSPDTDVYEVMETVNLPELIPGTTFRVKAGDNIKSYIGILDYDVLEITLVHAYDSKRIAIKGTQGQGNAVQVTTPEYSSFEVRHDHAGDSRSNAAYSAASEIAEAINNVSNSLEKKPNGKHE